MTQFFTGHFLTEFEMLIKMFLLIILVKLPHQRSYFMLGRRGDRSDIGDISGIPLDRWKSAETVTAGSRVTWGE